MSEQTTVTYSLETILKDINSKLEALQKDVGELKTDIVEVKNELKNIDKRLEKVEKSQEGLVKDVADLKGAKSLIIPIVVAVITSIATLLIRSIPIQ